MAGTKLILNKIVNLLSKVKEVKVIMLYGSFARGEYTSRSDIDIFVIISKNVKEQIEEKVIELENIVNKRIQPTIRTEKQIKSMDSGLLQNIFQEGKILFLREYFDIYKFDISNLKQNKKAEFNRELYGYKDKKYSYEGLIHKAKGTRLSSGSIIVPFGSKKRIEKFFIKSRIKFEEINVWK